MSDAKTPEDQSKETAPTPEAPSPSADPCPVTEDTIVEVILFTRPKSAEVFRKFRMRCPDCVVMEKHTVRHICMHDSLDPGILIRELMACPVSEDAVRELDEWRRKNAADGA